MSYWDSLDPFLQQQITDQANRLAHKEKYVNVLLEIMMRTMTERLRIYHLQLNASNYFSLRKEIILGNRLTVNRNLHQLENSTSEYHNYGPSAKRVFSLSFH